jgi:hypothetical protein
MFKHELGRKAESIATGLKGVLTSRSENLYGCNRYFIQPRVGQEQKIPEGWWIDEDDIITHEEIVKREVKTTGGPMSQKC